MPMEKGQDYLLYGEASLYLSLSLSLSVWHTHTHTHKLTHTHIHMHTLSNTVKELMLGILYEQLQR